MYCRKISYLSSLRVKDKTFIFYKYFNNYSTTFAYLLKRSIFPISKIELFTNANFFTTLNLYIYR